jgi:hypothetical protein
MGCATVTCVGRCLSFFCCRFIYYFVDCIIRIFCRISYYYFLHSYKFRLEFGIPFRNYFEKLELVCEHKILQFYYCFLHILKVIKNMKC